MQINLPVSLHLPETYGSVVLCRSCTSSDCFIFGIALLSSSHSCISFSGKSRSVPHWSSSCIIWSSFAFSKSLWPTWLYIILSSDVSFCKSCSNKSLMEEIFTIRLCWSLSPTQKWPSRNWEPFGVESVLDFEQRSELKPGAELTFWLLLVCLYSISHCFSAGWGKYLCTPEVPLLNISDNKILHYNLNRNFKI